MLSNGKLGFWGLTALVFGLVIGVGIFNLPQNFAGGASPAGVFISWIIVAAGILPLVIGFRWLSNRCPEYNAGIYHYAQAGFGNFAGFNVAWGYWLCTAFSNVAYGVMLNDSMGAFFPFLLNHGWPSALFCSLFIWVMYFIVSRGVTTAKVVNSTLAAVKVLMLIFIVVVFVMMFRMDIFTADIWGLDTGHNLWGQVKGTMMVALFCFFGIEGAVMMSSRARRPQDVGKAGVTGFFIALALYIAVSVLCYGILKRADLQGLPSPSVAYILRSSLGEWAYWFVIVAVIISLLGGWVAWTLVVAQVPYEAARVRILPRWFLHTNKHGMPDFGLMASCIAMECFLLLVFFADDAYLACLEITGLMIIPGYLFTGLFLLKKADTGAMRVCAVIIIIFCLWLAYAGGLKQMLMTSVFYLVGIGFYFRARKENRRSDPTPVLTKGERCFLLALIILSIATLILAIQAI